jgi:Holliday junction resolvasome RuvABC ATP-dependent DNA helicase subunit
LIPYGRIYRAKKYIMSTLSTQQINKLTKAKKDLKFIECVIDEALSNKEKYEEIQDWITKNAIEIPESLEPYMKNLFKVAKRGNIVTPEKPNTWLMKKKIENNEIVPTAQPHDM